MASVLPYSPRSGRLQVESDTLRFSPVCMECDETATLSVRRWAGVRSGFVPVRLCRSHAAAMHLRATALTTLAIVAVAVACAATLLQAHGVATMAWLALAVVVAISPWCMKARVRAAGDGFAVRGASVAFARHHRRGSLNDPGSILDGWFTVEHIRRLEPQSQAGAAEPDQLETMPSLLSRVTGTTKRAAATMAPTMSSECSTPR